ncbi:hypothetical protein K1719_002914 [Acacia pycnantha]|nr:hypothetical protein K1719_002914 [Acacia pycnantha]
MKEAVLVMGLALLSLVSVTSAAPGTATFYTQYVPSACYGNKEEGTMIAAASDALWDNGAVCGRNYKVTYNGKSVTVKIVDRCPSSSCNATLDLSEQAFSAIADPVLGKINIDYSQLFIFTLFYFNFHYTFDI